MNTEKYIGKKVRVPEQSDEHYNVFALSKNRHRIEIVCWADVNSNFVALNIVSDRGILRDIHIETFCWMCPEGKCAEKRIDRFPTLSAQRATRLLNRLLEA